VLLTQREEARRLRVDLTGFTAVPEKLRMVSNRISLCLILGDKRSYRREQRARPPKGMQLERGLVDKWRKDMKY